MQTVQTLRAYSSDPRSRPLLLVLEDDPLDFELLERQLARDGVDADLHHVQTRADYEAGLQLHPDLILADNAVPGFSGTEALEMRNESDREIPFILTSGAISEDFAIDCLRKGATDYVLKSNLTKFGPVVHRALQEAETRRERRRAELQIKQSEKRFRTLLSAISDITWVTAADGSVNSPLPSWSKFTGLSDPEYMGTGWVVAIHPDDRERVLRDWQDATRKRDTFSSEFRLRRHDGQHRWMQVHGVPVLDESGQVIEYTGVHFDINDKKVAEEKLEASEALYRATFDKATVGIAHVDPDGTWLRVNDRVCEITGYSREEMARLTFQDITHPDDLNADLKQYEQLLRGETERYRMEKRYYHKDGHIVWVDLTVALMRDAEGRAMHSISMIQDITLRKKTEAKLAEQSERLQAALISSGTGTFRWDIQTNALEWDENLDRLFGLAPGATARSLDQFISMVHPDDRSGVISRCERCAKEGADFEMEFRVIWPDGSQRWLYDRGKTFFGNDGKPAYMTGACTDITDAKTAEDALRRSEKLAAVASLASTISHEINNPLEAVMNCLFLIDTDPQLPPNLREYADLALGELNRAAHIVTQSLRFYRQSTRPTQTRVSETINSLVELFSQRLSRKDVKIVTDFSRERPVRAYESELRQVFANLLSNSLDAMPNGGTIVARVRAATSPAGESGVRVIFADTGTGMTKQVQRRVFEPFFTTKEINGTGLGLWVSQEIVQKHGGSIRVRSKTGAAHGTVFNIFIPHWRASDTLAATA